MISITKIRQKIEKEDEGPTLDYKENLTLETDGDKAQFVKDVISLANSGQTAHMIVGVEDITRKLLGIKTSHKAEQLNDILKDKCDPPISVEYAEKTVLGHKVGVVEINGENPPYIVAVTDRYGGPLSSNPQKSFSIERGTVFVRNFNKNEGARRADLDKMYKVKYVTLQANVQLTREVEIISAKDPKTAEVKFFLENTGEIIATDTLVILQFKNVKKIIKCAGTCRDISFVNDNIPTVGLHPEAPIVRPIRLHCGSTTIEVEQDVREIEARVIIGAMNMRTREGPYIIPLKE